VAAVADQQPPEGGQGKKILGMPRTTGIIVLGLAAVVVGYLVISHFSGSSSTSGSGTGGGGRGGGGYYGSGAGPLILVLRDWQGHGQKPPPKPPPKGGGDKGEGDDPHKGRNE
jgi:hypothetical protein